MKWIIKRVIFNHNTFINCAGCVFMNPGYQNNISLTINIFVNSNVQSYPAILTIDYSEQDPNYDYSTLSDEFEALGGDAHFTDSFAGLCYQDLSGRRKAAYLDYLKYTFLYEIETGPGNDYIFSGL